LSTGPTSANGDAAIISADAPVNCTSVSIAPAVSSVTNTMNARTFISIASRREAA
jgi:hypothetical protein